MERGHQPVDVSLAVAQGDLVVVGAGEQLGWSGRRYEPVPSASTSTIVGSQFRVLERQHPRDAAKSGLRQRDSISGIHLLCAPGDDPQPWAVPGAHLRHAS